MSLSKVWQVAAREFLATVSTRAFVVGLLVMPAMMAVAFALIPRLMNQRGRPIAGEVAVVDETGALGGAIAQALGPDAIAERRAAAVRQAQAALPEAMRGPATQAATARALGEAPMLTLVTHAAPFDRDRERRWLLDPGAATKHLAVVVVARDALARGDSGEYGGYHVYTPANLDTRVENTLYDGVRAALVSARTSARGLAARDVESMLRVARPSPVTLSATGDQTNSVGFSRALPYILTVLLFMGVMIGGQGLMTTTIEEKSSRIVEVMLSAVSPLELMTGKLIGQMAVGLLSIAVYVAMGLVVLASLAMLGLVDVTLIAYLVLFFLISYLLMGSMMMAIGSAVNEMREAQSLMTPVMVTMMLPWLLAAPILQNPSSTFAVVMSFLPPVNTFAMLLRLTSSAPPAMWQPLLSAAIGMVAVAGVIWCAAKVYRIGLLMYGKPPDFATLVRWVRAA